MRLLVLLSAAVLAACAANTRTPEPSGAVTGSVTYRERMALPPDAEARVQLFDVTHEDSAPSPVADTTIRPEGRQVPLPFVLRYDPRRIDPSHAYAVRATIASSGRTILTTTAVVQVITWEHPDHVDLVLTRVPAAGAAPSGTLWGTSWVLEDIGGEGVVDDARATLAFPEQGKAAGRGSCNSFSASVAITGPAINFGPLIATRMACADAVMNQESKYLKALQDAERFELEGDELRVYARGMDKPLRFTSLSSRP
jgi:putative lipoprotein